MRALAAVTWRVKATPDRTMKPHPPSVSRAPPPSFYLWVSLSPSPPCPSSPSLTPCPPVLSRLPPCFRPSLSPSPPAAEGRQGALRGSLGGPGRRGGRRPRRDPPRWDRRRRGRRRRRRQRRGRCGGRRGGRRGGRGPRSQQANGAPGCWESAPRASTRLEPGRSRGAEPAG